MLLWFRSEHRRLVAGIVRDCTSKELSSNYWLCGIRSANTRTANMALKRMEFGGVFWFVTVLTHGFFVTGSSFFWGFVKGRHGFFVTGSSSFWGFVKGRHWFFVTGSSSFWGSDDLPWSDVIGDPVLIGGWFIRVFPVGCKSGVDCSVTKDGASGVFGELLLFCSTLL